jgi:hypothetical protein
MNKKYTIEKARKIFKEEGCELLEEDYKNCMTKMEYKCNCGNISKISLDSFRRGHKCNKCGTERTKEKLKLSFEFVYNYFENQGCELLEKVYTNCDTPMKYKCDCGNISKISFYSFKNGNRCKKCAGIERHSFEYVKKYFEDNNCEILEDSYKNVRTLIKYVCSCGNIAEITFNNFEQGKRCMKCGGREKLTFDYVKNYFKEQGCELLEKKYINNRNKMKYICNCGNTSKISFMSFKRGSRCKKCMIEKNSGKNNYNYNYNLTDEDRMDRRLIPGYNEWVKNVYKKGNWICKKCKIKKDNNGKYKNINAHHIEGYAENKNLRTRVSNGIVLCRNCHNKFHKIYGKKNNNKQQLEEFLKMKNNLCPK